MDTQREEQSCQASTTAGIKLLIQLTSIFSPNIRPGKKKNSNENNKKKIRGACAIKNPFPAGEPVIIVVPGEIKNKGSAKA